jgi:acetyl-CoA carboxylase carboxyl transferase subunit beta
MVTLLDTLTSRGTPRSSASPVWSTLPRGRGSDDPELARDSNRPTPYDYLEQMRTGIIEIHGDRSGGSDPNLIAGIGRIEGVTVALVGTRSAPLSADGFRTLVRLYRLAGQLEIPVVSLIDAPGTPDIEPIQGAILSNAIAQSIRVAVSLPVPTISVITGTVSGPGGMALTIADTVLILEHANFAAGTDRQRPPSLIGSAPGSIWNARECLRLGVVDGVIPEPAGGAQADSAAAAQQLRLALVHALAESASMSQRRLLDERYRKLRHLGMATPAGREALHIEIAQLREIQQTLGRSIEELRGRLEIQQLGLPNLPSLPMRPTIGPLPTLPHVDLSSLPTRPSLPVMRRPGRSRPEMTHLAERFAATRRTLAERMQDVRSSLELDAIDASKEPPADA